VDNGFGFEFNADADMAPEAQVAALGVEQLGELGFMGLMARAASTD
jgi:hypothetical protein